MAHTQNQENLKRKSGEYAAEQLAALPLEELQLGIGSGSTVERFIASLGSLAERIRKPVASSSLASTKMLKKYNIHVEDTNSIGGIDIYIDGADEVDEHLRMIKGGGGALTGEKILAWMSKEFWCLADSSKSVNLLGQFPVAVETVTGARSLVARELVKLGGQPEYRHGFISDWGNPILDVYGLDLSDPLLMEKTLNCLPGTVCNGIFARTPATRLFRSVLTDSGAAEVQDILPQ